MAAAGRLAPAPEAVAEICRRAGFPLDGEQAVKLASYLALLLQWNRRMNLAGARSWREALSDLVLDSFHLSAFLKNLSSARGAGPGQTWDLGAGAGLPGIPLRMLWQEGEYWLIEAREKRALFLATVLARIPLPGVRVFRGRAEDFMRGRQADMILSRAFMPWRQVLDLAAPHLAPHGLVLLMTSETITEHEGWRVAKSMDYASGNAVRHITALACLRALPHA